MFLFHRHFIQGVRVGDVVVEVGSVNVSNFKSLQDIGSLVQHSQEVRVVNLANQYVWTLWCVKENCIVLVCSPTLYVFGDSVQSGWW